MSVKIKDKGWDKIKSLPDKHVVVGIFGDKASETYEDGLTTGQVATWNHFGTSNIPARPFISGPVETHSGQLRALGKRLHAGVLTKKLDQDKALSLYGEKIRVIIIQAINAGFPPPNAESTIQAKRSMHPLIDTGQLKGSITYQVRNGA